MQIRKSLATALTLATFGVAQAQTPAQTTANAPQIDSKAAEAVSNILLDPKVIEALANRLQGVRRANEAATNPVIAAPISRTVNVSFKSGGMPQIIRTVMGYTTSISFTDATGQPWPIHWDVNSNPNIEKVGTNANGETLAPAAFVSTGFEVNIPVKGGNVVNITTLSPSPRGNLVVLLDGAPGPISFMLQGDRSQFDATLAVNVRARGPHAKVEVVTRDDTPVTGSAELTQMLDGVAPADAVPQAVSGASPDDVRAWRRGNRMYILTSHSVVSPQPQALEYGEGGIGIFEIPAASNVLLAHSGRIQPIELKDR